MRVHCAWCGEFVRERQEEVKTGQAQRESHDTICCACMVIHFPEEAAVMGLVVDGAPVNGRLGVAALLAALTLAALFLCGLDLVYG